MRVKTAKPPGRKLVKQMPLRTKWLLLAPFSLVLIGYGLCALTEAAHLKHTNAPFIQWFAWGTYSLILINGGLSLFGQAIIFRVKIEIRRELNRKFKKVEKDVEDLRRKRKGGTGEALSIKKLEEPEIIKPIIND